MASVHAWAIVALFVICIVRRLAHAPSGAFVDDFFGCSRHGVRLGGGVVVSVALSLLGFLPDSKKDVTDAIIMSVLGARVAVQWSLRSVSWSI